jgi:hypothetical protein
MPQCAIHNFPHNIDHCLGLARSEFVGNFETVPEDTNAFLESGVSVFLGIVYGGDRIKCTQPLSCISRP